MKKKRSSKIRKEKLISNLIFNDFLFGDDELPPMKKSPLPPLSTTYTYIFKSMKILPFNVTVYLKNELLRNLTSKLFKSMKILPLNIEDNLQKKRLGSLVNMTSKSMKILPFDVTVYLKNELLRNLTSKLFKSMKILPLNIEDNLQKKELGSLIKPQKKKLVDLIEDDIRNNLQKKRLEDIINNLQKKRLGSLVNMTSKSMKILPFDVTVYLKNELLRNLTSKLLNSMKILPLNIEDHIKESSIKKFNITYAITKPILKNEQEKIENELNNILKNIKNVKNYKIEIEENSVDNSLTVIMNIEYDPDIDYREIMNKLDQLNSNISEQNLQVTKETIKKSIKLLHLPIDYKFRISKLETELKELINNLKTEKEKKTIYNYKLIKTKIENLISYYTKIEDKKNVLAYKSLLEKANKKLLDTTIENIKQSIKLLQLPEFINREKLAENVKNQLIALTTDNTDDDKIIKIEFENKIKNLIQSCPVKNLLSVEKEIVGFNNQIKEIFKNTLPKFFYIILFILFLFGLINIFRNLEVGSSYQYKYGIFDDGSKMTNEEMLNIFSFITATYKVDDLVESVDFKEKYNKSQWFLKQPEQINCKFVYGYRNKILKDVISNNYSNFLDKPTNISDITNQIINITNNLLEILFDYKYCLDKEKIKKLAKRTSISIKILPINIEVYLKNERFMRIKEKLTDKYLSLDDYKNLERELNKFRNNEARNIRNKISREIKIKIKKEKEKEKEKENVKNSLKLLHLSVDDFIKKEQYQQKLKNQKFPLKKESLTPPVNRRNVKLRSNEKTKKEKEKARKENIKEERQNRLASLREKLSEKDLVKQISISMQILPINIKKQFEDIIAIKEFEKYLYDMFIETEAIKRSWVDKQYGDLFPGMEKNKAFKHLKQIVKNKYIENPSNLEFVNEIWDYIDKKIENEVDPLKNIYKKSGKIKRRRDNTVQSYEYVVGLDNTQKEIVLERLQKFSKKLKEEMDDDDIK